MAEVQPTASTASPAAGTRTGSGFELRLERGGAHVRLGAPAAIAGLLVEHLDLKVPDIALPFDAGSGPSQFRNRLCDLDALTVLASPQAVSAAAARLDLGELGLGELEVALRDGFAEVGGRLASGPAFTMRLGLLPGFERGVAVVPYAPRIYGPAALPAAALPHLAARALSALGLPDDPLPLLARRLLVSRGWKVPREGGVRLAAATVGPSGVRLAWARETQAPPPASSDPDLLAALEGSSAFSEAEALAAAGDWAGAREAWLASAAPTAHAFAADRLLSLLCLDERFHDEALDLAAGWLQRRPGFAPALAAEAWVRSSRGEHGRAAVALVELAVGSVAAGERLAAVAAAEAVLALPGIDGDLTARAVDAALAAKRDHLPALRALRSLARERGDKGAQVRAARRVLAYAPTDLEKARAHAELGELLLESDPPGARLHLDRALRLAPEDAESLLALARACAAAGEHLRVIGALDRLRALRRRAGDLSGAVALALEAGATWDQRLGHVENALLRYREAAELGPRAAEAHRLAASCAERLGRWAEAADHHAAALAVLDRTAPDAGALAAAHHLALANVAERHLDDQAGAATHLEAAQATAPLDAAQLARLATLHRRLGRHAELLHALDQLAPLTEDPTARAALLAEAGDLARGPVGRPDLAAPRYGAALQLDGACRPAIEGLAALAQARGDGAAERDALQKLVPLARDRAEEASLLDRLAAASVRAGDLSAAARAVAAARRAAPSRERLAAAAGLARRSGDRPGLAALLAEQAQAASAAGDRSAAGAAWRERAELLAETDAALALTALDEARAHLPDDAGLVHLEALLAERTGDHHRALGALRAQLAGAPAGAGALELRAARAALAAEELSSARAHAERALAAGERGAGEVLVGALERSGDPAGQLEALTLSGRHLEAASLAERLGDGPAAIRALERAAEEKASAGEALRHLLRIHAAAGDAAAAAATLLSAARRTGQREGAALAWRAFSLTGDPAALDLAAGSDPSFSPARAERAARRAASDPAGALADAEAALAGEGLDPARRPGLLGLAASLAERTGDRELARRRLAAACQAGNPTDSELAHLAELHRAAGDLDGLAATLIRRAASAPLPGAPRLHLELADLLARLGREPEALESWRAVLRIDPVALEPIRALLAPARAALLHDGEREPLLLTLAGHDGASQAERAAAWDGLAEARQAAGDAAGASQARGEAARCRGDDDQGLERRAQAASAAGDHPGAARLLLQRARRAQASGETGAAERLAESGLALVEAGELAEGEAVLREALSLHPEPERARGALTALVALAAERSDALAEAQALASLVPLVPAGERPERLIRLAWLRASAGDRAGALDAAEQARLLAPRTLAAVRQARLAAAAAGEERMVAQRLEEEARLDEQEAGALLLERARLLARLGDVEASDQAYTESLSRLAPDQGLALEQVRLRRSHLPRRPPSEPMERFAGRLEDQAASARAQAAAAALAWEAGDGGAALRCARRAFGRSRQTPALAGPLLARLLYAQGSFAEALVVHRTLLELGFPGFDEGEVVTLSRQLAELATEDQDVGLALQALDRLLALRPQEPGAALERFRLDPDRRRAVTELEAVAGQVRSGEARIELLAAAAEGALAELRDRRLGERLFREARAEAALVPGRVIALERRRVVATRLGELGPEALLGALHEAAEAALAAGDAATACDLLEDAVSEQRQRGMKRGAARDLLELERLLAARGDGEAASARAREAAELLAEPGDTGAFRKAVTPMPQAPPAPPAPPLQEVKASEATSTSTTTPPAPAAEPALEPGVEPLEEAAVDPAGAPKVKRVTLEFPAPDLRAAEAPADALGEGEPEARPPQEPAFEPIVGPRTLDLPSPRLNTLEMPVVEIPLDLPIEPQAPPDLPQAEGLPAGEAAAPDLLAQAHQLARQAESAVDPASRAAAWLASADAAHRAGAAPEEVRLAIELACEAEPDAPSPWMALAELELAQGDPLAAARAHLAVSIRTEGTTAANAALVAARLFLEQGHPGDAARALRAATLGNPAVVPPELVQATEYVAGERQAAAASLLTRLEPTGLEPPARAVLDQLRAMIDWSAGIDEVATLEPAPLLAEAPVTMPEPTPDPVPAPMPELLQGASPEEAAVGSEFGAALDAAFGEFLDSPPPELALSSAVEPIAPEAAAPAGPAETLEPSEPVEPEVPTARGPHLEVAAPQPRSDDPVMAHLRAEAEAASGPERASALEKLAAMLERQGEPGAAADALIEALFTDADRELTWGWLDSLVTDDPERAARVAALRRVQARSPAVTAPPAETPAPALAAPPAEALERALAAARQDPSDADALLEVAGVASRLVHSASPHDRDRLAELARVALSIAAFVAPGRTGPPEPSPLAAALSAAARDRAALAECIGPLGKLLELLAPHLEPLFPADLPRRGATAEDRLVRPRAPEVLDPLDDAAALLSSREFATFLVDRPGAAIALENTNPPALVVPTGFTALPLGARRFLAVRALDLLERGGALLGKFAPRDVGILLELACRFAGGKPPPLGLPAGRAGAFLSALARSVPPVVAARVASLGPRASVELAGVDLGALNAAVVRSSGRVALLATGDPAGAFAALLAAEPPSRPLDGAEALRLPALRELATLALSDPFLDLRLAVVG